MSRYIYKSKKTCGKLGYTFLGYLEDRINRLYEIPKLGQVILDRSTGRASG